MFISVLDGRAVMPCLEIRFAAAQNPAHGPGIVSVGIRPYACFQPPMRRLSVISAPPGHPVSRWVGRQTKIAPQQSNIRLTSHP